ncbi:MAG: hypothetical protein CFE31_03735 [Rhizobiales bacterium PAR1]|nr:MAG: hypothetical protein CFE31_03735 [Rhizobiales bacterium PAR1]
MRRFPLYTLTHLAVFIAGIALGIYLLPILTAAPPPSESTFSELMQGERLMGRFDRDIRGSDFLHWGEGEVIVSAKRIAHRGKLAPGPDYKLYLVPQFVENAEAFLAVKDKSLNLGDVKGFSGFMLNVPPEVDVKAYTTVVIWCERFGKFISAAQYRTAG